MYKSWSDDEERSEWKDVEKPDHIARVWAAIEANVPKYFSSLVAPKMASGNDLLEKLALTGNFKVAAKKTKTAQKPTPADGTAFEQALASYDKKARKYRDFFNSETLTEFRDDDPDAFKDALSRKCPVILAILQAKSAELKEWLFKYSQTPSEALLSTFENLVGFAQTYVAAHRDETEYAKLDGIDAFKFDGFDNEASGLPGVIGGGIKSTVLYHLEPRLFPERSGAAMYALYFLTDEKSFELRSKSSEFLMINDRLAGEDVNIKMDHNYWYSYRLFTLFALRLSRIIGTACHAYGLPFDVNHRYVYLNALLLHVVETHKPDMKILRGVDDLREQFWAAR
jgi:hypothetical protein